MQRIYGALVEPRQLQAEGAGTFALTVDQEGAYTDQVRGGVDPVEGVDQQGRAEPRLLGAAIHSEASQQDDRSAMDTALYTTAPGWSSPPPEKRTEELIL